MSPKLAIPFVLDCNGQPIVDAVFFINTVSTPPAPPKREYGPLVWSWEMRAGFDPLLRIVKKCSKCSAIRSGVKALAYAHWKRTITPNGDGSYTEEFLCVRCAKGLTPEVWSEIAQMKCSGCGTSASVLPAEDLRGPLPVGWTKEDPPSEYMPHYYCKHCSKTKKGNTEEEG